MTPGPQRSELRSPDLDRFFNPSVVAVVGASQDRAPNSTIWRHMRDWATSHGARAIPVNPNRDRIDSLKCYPSLTAIGTDLGEPIDLVVILVSDAVAAFAEAVEVGARFAVIFSAGFAEVGERGASLQAELADLVKGSDTHLLGPNTNLNAFEDFDESLPGRRLALITQSGHQGRPVFQAQSLGVAMSHWAPTGNEVDLEFADFAAYFVQRRTQDSIGAVAAYIEGFANGRTLTLAADHAIANGLPIVCVKVGRAEVGASMALSHTGHLSGTDRVISDVFNQFGVIRVEGLDELTDVSAMFCRTVAPPPGHAELRRVAVYSISGGTAAHMADMLAAAGLNLPELAADTQDLLRECIPGYLRVSNPVDSGGHPSADERGIRILDAIVEDPNVDLVVIPITGAVPSISTQLTSDIVEVVARTDKPIFVVWGSPTWDAEYADVLMPAQIPVFRTFANCVTAADAWFRFHETAQRWESPYRNAVDGPHQRDVPIEEFPSGPMDEPSSKAVVAGYGIAVTEDILCHTPQEAAAAAARLDRGEGVVMKAVAAGIPHKGDHGLVRLRVPPQHAESVWQELRDAAQAASGESPDGVLVCEMLSGGTECVVGITHDALFGNVVMFGLGGTLVEVFDDVAFRVPPFDRAEARRMIAQTKVAQILRGQRGQPPADLESVVDVIMALQRMATEHPRDLAEVDINPLLVSDSGAVALDALVVGGGAPRLG